MVNPVPASPLYANRQTLPRFGEQSRTASSEATFVGKDAPSTPKHTGTYWRLFKLGTLLMALNAVTPSVMGALPALQRAAQTQRGETYSRQFNDAFNFMMQLEGDGDVNEDSGGPTQWGISSRAYPQFQDQIEDGKLPKAVAKRILYNDYWLRSGADKIADRTLAFLHFDAAVNHGVGAARWFYDQAKDKPNPYDTYMQFRIAAYQGEARYANIVIPKNLRVKNGDAYANGWMNRLNAVDRYFGKPINPTRYNFRVNQVEVEAGDALSEIAERYGVSQAAILAYNPDIKNPGQIRIGQVIQVPQFIHLIKKGELLPRIADQYHISVETLVQVNDITNPNNIKAGNRLVIPIFVHVLQPGQNLGIVAQGTSFSAQELQKLNGIKDLTKIPPGTRIIIPGTSRNSAGSEVELARGESRTISGKNYDRLETVSNLDSYKGKGGIFQFAPVRGPIPPRGQVGAERASGGHKAVDLYAPVGTPIVAPMDGVVHKITPHNGIAGLTVDIYHGTDPRTKKPLYTRYFHLSKTNVQKGQRVKAGQVIGRLGTSGMPRSGSGVACYVNNAYSGKVMYSHLHFEVHAGGIRRGKTRQDPMNYLPNLAVFKQFGDYKGKGTCSSG